MEYQIKDANSKFYTPSVEEWIYATFNFNMQEAMLYKIILSKGYKTWSWAYFAKVLRVSSRTVGRLLKKLADMDVIEQSTVFTKGTKTRTINIAKYDKNGRIPDNLITYYKKQGLAEIKAQEED